MDYLIDNQKIDFEGDIDFVWLNPLTNKTGSHSLEFSFPLTNKNRINFKWPDNLSSYNIDNDIKEYATEIATKFFKLIGTTKINSVSDKRIKSYFKGNGDIYSLSREKKLSEFNFGGELLFEDVYNESFDVSSGNYPPALFLFHKNEGFYSDLEFQVIGFDGIINDYPLTQNVNKPLVPFFNLNYIIKKYFHELGFVIESNDIENDSTLKSTYIPNNYLPGKLKFEEDNSYSNHVFSAQKNQIKTFLWHNLSVGDFIELEGSTFLNYNYNYDSINTRICQVTKVIDNNTIEINADVTTDDTSYLYFINDSSSVYNYPFISFINANGNFTPPYDNDFDWGVTVYPGLVIFSDEPFYANVGDILQLQSSDFYNLGNYVSVLQPRVKIKKHILNVEYDNTIIPGNHLPDITAGEFIDNLEKFIGIKFFIDIAAKYVNIVSLNSIFLNNNIVDITRFAENEKDISTEKITGFKLSCEPDSNDSLYSNMVSDLPDNIIIKDSVNSFTNLPPSSEWEENEVRLVKQYYNSYYKQNSKNRFKDIELTHYTAVNRQWKYLSYNLLSYVYGDSSYSYTTKFSTLLTDYDDLYPTRSMLSAPAVINGEGKKIGPRLTFYRGLYLYKSLYQYPLVTHNNYDLDKNLINSITLNLDWNGDKGLFNQRFEKFFDWLMNRKKEIENKIHWPVWLLHNFNFARKYLIKDVVYFVDSIKFKYISQNDTIEHKKTTLFRA